MRASRFVTAVLAAAGAGLALAQNLGQEKAPADAWSFRSLRARAAKKTYDQGARRASDRYTSELNRLKKPLVHTLETALKRAEGAQDKEEAGKLRSALRQASEGSLVPPTTETVGWSAKFEGRCYLAILVPVKWDEARAICRRLGGRLACIETRQEMVFLQNLTSGVGVYVGATDVHREGDWRWVSGRPVDRALWKIKEPDGQGGQNYAALSTAGLYDVSDGDTGMKGFICQWDQ